MAIENALIAKIGGGLVAASGAGGAGFYYRAPIADAFNKFFTTESSKEESDSFLIVVNTTEEVTINHELHVGDKKTPNFKCKFGDQTDDKCDIYKLPAIVNNKLSDLEKIKAFNVNPTNSEIKQNTYFKLKIKKDLIKNPKFDGTETISLIKTSDDSSITTFSVLYKLENKKFQGKTNLLIGKSVALADAFDTSSGTFQCKLKNEDDSALKDCTIYKFTTQTGNQENHKNLSFESGNISSSSITKTDISPNKFLIIKLSDDKSLSDLDANQTIIYVKKSGGTSTQVAEIPFISGLAKDTNFDTSKNTFFLS